MGVGAARRCTLARGTDAGIADERGRGDDLIYCVAGGWRAWLSVAALFVQLRGGGAQEGVQRGQQQAGQEVGGEEGAQFEQQRDEAEPVGRWAAVR